MTATLIDRAMSELSARQSASSSPTHGTPAGQTAGGPTRPTPEHRQATTELVSRVFSRLEVIFPRTWSSAFSTAGQVTLAKRELAMELAKWPALPTPRVVERAMSELKQSGSTWPPTIPVLVRMLAPTPEDFGMPAAGDAWAEVCAHCHMPGDHRWRHEAVKLAARATGWWELRHVTPSRIDRLEKRFARHYQALVNRVMRGEALAPRELLEHDGSRSAAELAERAGREAAQQQAEAAGLPHAMTADQGLRSLRAALKGA